MTILEKISSDEIKLPTLPSIYVTLSEALSDSKTGIEELSKIISSDQASTIKILRVVNSSSFGLSGHVDTISRAILYLGFNEIHNIILALSIINMFEKRKILQDFKPVDFWAHSIAVGTSARLIGEALGVTKLENYFVAGILHDIGKLLFFDQFPDEFEEVLIYCEKNKVPIIEAENKILGLGHDSAGELLAARWNLPNSFRNVIANHHSGFSNGKLDPLVMSVHLADVVARFLGLGFPGDNLIIQPNNVIFENIDLPKNFFTNLLPRLTESYKETIDLLLTD
jgi:putative nucleotidyltransferase with HDIG domain